MEAWFYRNADELKKTVIMVFGSLLLFSVSAFSFGVRSFTVKGLSLPYPVLSTNDNVASLLFGRIRTDLLPPDVELIVTAPSDALLVQLSLSVFVGFLLSLPVLVYYLGRFLVPGLNKNERKTVGKTVLPAVLLFVMGSLFSYFLIIPLMLRFLYGYVFEVGAQPYLAVGSFVSFVVTFILAFGFIFTLPVFMASLTRLGVQPSFWKKACRYAIGLMVILGALITPDGSIVTLAMVAGPMVAMYFIGYLASLWVKKA